MIPSPNCSPPPPPAPCPQVCLLFSIQTDYSPEQGGWGRDASRQALRRLERKFETHVCCLGSGNPEPSAPRVAQGSPLPLLPAPPGSPRGLFSSLSPCQGKLAGSLGPEELGARAALSLKEVLRPPEGAQLAADKGPSGSLTPDSTGGRRGSRPLGERPPPPPGPPLSGSHPPTPRPGRTCLFSALAPAAFCLTLSQPELSHPRHSGASIWGGRGRLAIAGSGGWSLGQRPKVRPSDRFCLMLFIWNVFPAISLWPPNMWLQSLP